MLLGLGDLTDQIAQAIYQMEGSGPTTIATRNNNPGNLRSGPGQIGTNGGFAVFPDMATGWAALDNQINLNISRGLTLNQFFGGLPGVYAGYAPSADSNNPSAYAAFVASQVGIDPNTPLNSLDSGASTIPPFDPGTGIDTSGDTSGTSDASLFSGITPWLLGGMALLGVLVWAGGRG